MIASMMVLTGPLTFWFVKTSHCFVCSSSWSSSISVVAMTIVWWHLRLACFQISSIFVVGVCPFQGYVSVFMCGGMV